MLEAVKKKKEHHDECSRVIDVTLVPGGLTRQKDSEQSRRTNDGKM